MANEVPALAPPPAISAAALNVDKTEGKLRVVDMMGTTGEIGRNEVDDNDVDGTDNDIVTDDAVDDDIGGSDCDPPAVLNANVRVFGKVGGGGGGAEVSSSKDKISVTLQKYFHDEFSTIFGKNLSALDLTLLLLLLAEGMKPSLVLTRT